MHAYPLPRFQLTTVRRSVIAPHTNPANSLATATTVGPAMYGTPSGLTVVDDQVWSQYTYRIEDAPEEDDDFGSSVA